MVRITGAVLAAGSGRRLGTPKAELVVHGVRLLDRAVAALRDGGCDPVLAIVRTGTLVSDAIAISNPQPERGMRSSLELAVAAIGEADSLAVLLVDTPGITADSVRAVLAAWRPGRIAIGRYGTSRAHPIVMDGALWRDALQLAEPDAGARAMLRARPDLVDEVAVPGNPIDLDTPDDLARWQGLPD